MGSNGTRSMMKVEAKLDYLSSIREFVKAGADMCGLEAARTHSIMIAVDEAFTNIVVHGYKRKPGVVEVELEHTPSQFIIRLRDSAPQFDPTKVPAPDITLPIEKRPIGGMGVFLISRAMDVVKYRPLPKGGNELTLVATLSK